MPGYKIQKGLDRLAKKWGLPGIRFEPHSGKVSFRAEDNAVQVIPYKNRKDRSYIDVKDKQHKDEEVTLIPVVYVGRGKQKTMYKDLSPSLEEKRYLTLRIDLNEKKGELMKQFGEKIDTYKKYAKQPEGREGKTKYDPWVIYNTHHKNKLSFTEIARKLSCEKGNPTYNPELAAALKAVKRAYNVAKENIKRVEVEVQNREKHNILMDV